MWNGISHQRTSFRWLSARLQYLQCVALSHWFTLADEILRDITAFMLSSNGAHKQIRWPSVVTGPIMIVGKMHSDGFHLWFIILSIHALFQMHFHSRFYFIHDFISGAFAASKNFANLGRGAKYLGHRYHCGRGRYDLIYTLTLEITFRDHFVYAPSQWETTLHCNIVSHWLGAYTKWSLYFGLETYCFWGHHFYCHSLSWSNVRLLIDGYLAENHFF